VKWGRNGRLRGAMGGITSGGGGLIFRLLVACDENSTCKDPACKISNPGMDGNERGYMCGHLPPRQTDRDDGMRQDPKAQQIRAIT
jgi:hypothetical protein